MVLKVSLESLFIVSLLLAVTFSWQADDHSNHTLESIRKIGLLKVGLTGDYAPYSYYNGKHFVGIDVEMSKDLAKYFGVRLDLIKTEWKTLETDLSDNRFHIAMGGISVSDNREKYGYFSQSLIEDGKMPIVRCENRDKFKTIEDINKQSVRVIVNPGGTNFKFAHEHFKNATITVFNDNRLIFNEIAENRADVMVTEGIEVELQSKRFPGVLCPANAKPFNKIHLAYYMPKDEQFRSEVNNWLTNAKKTVFATAKDYYLSYNFAQQ